MNKSHFSNLYLTLATCFIENSFRPISAITAYVFSCPPAFSPSLPSWCYDCRLAAEENTRTSDVKRGVFPLCRVADSRMADGQASRSSSRQDNMQDRQHARQHTNMTSNHKTIRAQALHSNDRTHTNEIGHLLGRTVPWSTPPHGQRSPARIFRI